MTMRTLPILLALAMISSNALADLRTPEAGGDPAIDGGRCVVNGFNLAGNYADFVAAHPGIAGTDAQYRARALALCGERGIFINNASPTAPTNANIAGGLTTLSAAEIESCELVTTGPAGQVTLNGIPTTGQIVCNDYY
jgi:hypothetical protein